MTEDRIERIPPDDEIASTPKKASKPKPRRRTSYSGYMDNMPGGGPNPNHRPGDAAGLRFATPKIWHRFNTGGK